MAKVANAPELLMPKASAVWLIDNTVLTFSQIANFTGLTEIEIEALANEDIGKGLVGRNPVEHKEITKEELDRCQADPTSHLQRCKNHLPQVKMRSKGPRYTPVSKRADKPNAIAFILKNYPDISDAQIVKLVGTTKPTIAAIRDRSHTSSSSLQPRHPADLGLCSYTEFEATYEKALRAAGKDPEKIKAQKDASQAKAFEEENERNKSEQNNMAGFDFSNFLSGSSN
jgi:hypothetical protein